jgi:hypothetical protein
MERGSMRRHRRLDLHPAAPGEPYAVEILFRDSYVEPDGTETVVHEYGVTAAIDRDATVLAVDAEAHALPGPDCPLAVASATRIVGMPLERVRAHVREHFGGTSTCTHLNDALRSLGDLAGLLPLVGA